MWLMSHCVSSACLLEPCIVPVGGHVCLQLIVVWQWAGLWVSSLTHCTVMTTHRLLWPLTACAAGGDIYIISEFFIQYLKGGQKYPPEMKVSGPVINVVRIT